MSALASGVMFYRWRRVGEEAQQHLWRLYGWFSGLMLCGSCIGVVTWTAWMQVAANEFTSIKDRTLSYSESLLFFSVSNSWRAVFTVTYAMEFLCLSVAKLIVLDRMSDFAAGLWILKHWAAGRRAVIACVVAGNVVGLAGNIAAAVHFHRVAQLLSAASADYAANDIALGTKKIEESLGPSQLANNIASVQAFCEVAVLLLIVVAFAVVGALCVRRISSHIAEIHRLSSRITECDAADTAGKQLRRQIIGTTAVVFVTFLIRSVFSTMSAVASKLQDMSKSCVGVTSLCDASCFNVFTHVFIWMQYTPEFQLTIVLISKPLPLLVALWGMTSQRLRRQMQTNETDTSL
jgi:uncharacterized protein YqgC (DUF456 family)